MTSFEVTHTKAVLGIIIVVFLKWKGNSVN